MNDPKFDVQKIVSPEAWYEYQILTTSSKFDKSVKFRLIHCPVKESTRYIGYAQEAILHAK